MTLCPLRCQQDAANMSIDDLTSTTRVFVSGLPPSFTSKDLRAFFGEKFTVTDAHVLPDRRIGFVGLADHESAENSAKYFNKSFIRMSKISVELARPVDVKRSNSGQAAPISSRTPRYYAEASDGKLGVLKRKRDGLDDGEQLRSQPASKQEDVPKFEKSRLARKMDNTAVDEPSAPSHGHDQNHSRTQARSESADDTIKPSGPDPQPVTAADSDWLRGKTSRVLDLEGPGEEEQRTAPAVLRSPELETDTTLEDTDAKVQIELSSDDGPEVPNGRLFLRNLAFEANEDDIRTLLTPFGNVQEVSLLLCIFNPHPSMMLS